MTYRRCWATILMLVFIASCGINGDLKRIAESRRQALTQTRSQIVSARDKYDAWKKTTAYDRFARYDKTYGWADQYAAALAEADSAQTIWVEIEQILDANDPEDEARLRHKISQLDSRLNLALAKSKQPNRQIGVLRALMDDAPTHLAKGGKQVAGMEAIVSDIRPIADQAVADSKAFGWDKEKDIAQRFSRLEGLAGTAAQALARAKAQYEAADTNYAAMADSLQAVAQKRVELEQAGIHVKQLYSELNRSYTKRLIDMKYFYTVTIGRTSWDDYYDYPTETNYIYSPRQVDEETSQYLSKQSGDIASGLRWVRPRIPDRMWRSLDIASAERAPSGDDNAVFWVNDTDINYYHRYLIIENGRERESDWEAVDEDLFAANIENLGMDIESKPYGMYASETIETATPPVMAYVGNEKYGRWQKNASGNSFWVFYGRYAFLNAMLGSNRYYYGDWTDWRRNYRGRSPYYGRNTDGSARYGTMGSTVRNNPKYKSSTFARQGGIKAAPADIRSAAGGVRGRGPGSRGK